VNTRAIAGILVLAVLTPSCLGGGGSGGSKSFPAPIPKWQTQQRSPTSSDLRAVLFANGLVGIVAGKDGSIFHTADGGVTWLQEEFTPAKRTGDIAALAGQNSRIVAVGSDTLGAREWVSDDSFTWTTPDVDSAIASPWVDVNMNAGGVAPGAPVDVYRLRKNGTVDYSLRDGTSNSGGTTTWVSANGIASVFKFNLQFICGENPANTGQIYAVPAGNCPVPAAKTFRRITVSPNGQPFACGDDGADHGIVAYVNDPDITNPTPPFIKMLGGPAAAPSFQAISFGDVNVGYVVGNAGTIYRMAFDGVSTWTWTNQSVAIPENFYAVHFISRDLGWAVGDKGTVFRTVNGSGTGTWTRVSSGDAGINWNALSFSDDGVRGVAVGNQNGTNTAKIYRTINAGVTWTSMTLPTGPNLALTTQSVNGVSVPRTALDGTTAYICCDSGRVYRNTDVWGVGTWNDQSITGLTGTDNYRAIHFPQAGDKGVVVGVNGVTPVLLRTSNGTTWTARTPGGFTAPTGPYLSLSSTQAATAIYASGDDGVINVSTDAANGWLAWTDITPVPAGTPPAGLLSSIQAPDAFFFKAFVASDNGNIYRLSKGTPPTWATQFGAPPWGAAKPLLGFQDLDGLVVTDAGGLFHSFDGGLNWNVSLPHTKAVPRRIWASPTVGGLFYVGCDDGVILRTESGGH
jgi:photosystem II stability/assembly factor-like uncharacterized protein